MIVYMFLIFFFFFSSRRRHTRYIGDWSSDVCSSDLNFIERQHKAGKPFFAWVNSTRMHIYTHLKPESKGKTGLGLEEIGRASCRERVESWVVAGSLKEKR